MQKTPRWAIKELGERPADPRTADAWDSAVRSVVRARLQADPTSPVDGFGEAPTDRNTRATWLEAQEQLERSRQSLQRDSDHEPAWPAGPAL